MNRHTYQKNSGFIALISSVIISVVLLLTITTLSFNGYYNRFNVFESEMKERSQALAKACINIALLRIVSGEKYTGNTAISISDTESCRVGEITHQSGMYSFKTSAEHYNSQTNYKVTVNDADFSIKSLEETATF